MSLIQMRRYVEPTPGYEQGVQVFRNKLKGKLTDDKLDAFLESIRTNLRLKAHECEDDVIINIPKVYRFIPAKRPHGCPETRVTFCIKGHGYRETVLLLEIYTWPLRQGKRQESR